MPLASAPLPSQQAPTAYQIAQAQGQRRAHADGLPLAQVAQHQRAQYQRAQSIHQVDEMPGLLGPAAPAQFFSRSQSLQLPNDISGGQK